jgi:hypothetical protein
MTKNQLMFIKDASNCGFKLHTIHRPMLNGLEIRCPAIIFDYCSYFHSNAVYSVEQYGIIKLYYAEH